MINPAPPSDWNDLQEQVARILTESGIDAETKKVVATSRGRVEIDVYAHDKSQSPASIILCECKHWKTRVPQKDVHAFRTVVVDCGANLGLMISSAGFQSGAHETVKHSNVRLLNWQEFQKLYVDRWYRNYMLPRLKHVNEPLVDYTEPYNTRVLRNARSFTAAQQHDFAKLQKLYGTLAFLVLRLYAAWHGTARPELPLCANTKSLPRTEPGLPADILGAESYREILSLIEEHVCKGIAAFDNVFGRSE